MIRLGETAVVLGFWVAGLCSSDMIIAGLLFAAGFIISCIAIFAEPTRNRKAKILFCSVVALVMVVGFGVTYWRHQADEPHLGILETSSGSIAEVPPTILSDQMRAIDQIDDLFAGKDEMALRNMTDLPNMLRYNLAMIQRSLNPSSVTGDESKEIDRVFAGGQAQINSNYLDIKRGSGGTFEVQMIPREVGIINMTAKHINYIKILRELEYLPSLPASISSALKDYDTADQDNINLMFTVINEEIKANPNNVWYETDQNSAYFGVISNTYWQECTPLEPKAQKILDAIRSYLGTKYLINPPN